MVANPQAPPIPPGGQPLGQGTYDDLANYNAQGHPIGGKVPFPTKTQRARMGRRADVAYQANLRQQAFFQRQAAYQQVQGTRDQARLDARRKAIAARVAARQRQAYVRAGVETGSGLVGQIAKVVNNAQAGLVAIPTPGGIGFLLFAVLVLLFFLIPVGVGSKGNNFGKTRANLAYDVITGNATIPVEPDTTTPADNSPGTQPPSQPSDLSPTGTRFLAAATPLTNAGLFQNTPAPPPGTTQVGSAEALTTVQPWVIPGMIVVPGSIETPM